MSMGGSQQTPTTQTVTQSNIPKEFMPYFSRLMGRVEEQSLQGYQPYKFPRLASSSDFADIGASLTGEGGSASPAEQTKALIEQGVDPDVAARAVRYGRG